jgi:hypothetical protein
VDLAAPALSEALLIVAVEAGVVANVCDHAEHNESSDIADVKMAGYRMRSCALDLAAGAGCNPIELYRERLRQIERRNVLFEEGGYDGTEHVSAEPTWRELQLAQVGHDRYYHPDVLGLSKLDQLRHFALHLAKLAGAIASTISGDTPQADLLCRRVPDLLIFGLKLSTVSGERLPSEPVLTPRGWNRDAASGLSVFE